MKRLLIATVAALALLCSSASANGLYPCPGGCNLQELYPLETPEVTPSSVTVAWRLQPAFGQPPPIVLGYWLYLWEGTRYSQPIAGMGLAADKTRWTFAGLHSSNTYYANVCVAVVEMPWAPWEGRCAGQLGVTTPHRLGPARVR